MVRLFVGALDIPTVRARECAWSRPGLGIGTFGDNGMGLCHWGGSSCIRSTGRNDGDVGRVGEGTASQITLETWLGALMVVLWFDPSSVATPGFQLSFMAVVGLVRVTPWISGRLGNPSGWRGWFVGGLSATLGATVGTCRWRGGGFRR